MEPAAPLASCGRVRPGPSHRDLRLHLQVLALADAGDLPQLVDAAEPAVLRTPVDDALGEHRPDARQPVQLLHPRAVQIQQRRSTGRTAGSRRGRHPDEHLLAVDEPAREVQQPDGRGRTTGCTYGVVDAAARREPDEAGAPDAAADRHDDLAGRVGVLTHRRAGPLDGLPGIGPVLAERIVVWRTEHGRFASVDQLREVPGIGESKYLQVKAKVTA